MRLIDADELRKWYSETSEEGKYGYDVFTSEVLKDIDNAPTIDARAEPLTDEEQRMFLSAMRRMEYICKHVDAVYEASYEDSLVRVCHEIIRKVKLGLFNESVEGHAEEI